MTPQVSEARQGQVLLITLLALSVAVTVALSLISRETMNTAISNQVAESARAFSAAEAGIEQALKTGQDTAGSQEVLSPGLSFIVTKNTVGGQEGTYVMPKITPKGIDEVLWLTEHNEDGTLVESPTGDYNGSYIDLCWTDAVVKPAVIVSILYKRSGQYNITRGAYDPIAGSRSPTNNFSAVTDAANGCNGTAGTAFRQRIDMGTFISGFDPASDVLIMARFRPVYADTQFEITTPPGVPINLQGYAYEASGITEQGLTRNIIARKQYRAASSIFDYSIYSQNGSFSTQ